MRISDWSSDVCSSDLDGRFLVSPKRMAELRKIHTDEQLQSMKLVAVHPDFQVIAQIGRHTSELQSLMRISYAVFCLKKKTNNNIKHTLTSTTNSKHKHTITLQRTYERISKLVN